MAKRKGVSLSVGRGEKSKKGGLTAKGRAKYNRATGSNLQAPVTEKNPTGKRAARRKSFCARMKGVKGPMKDSNLYKYWRYRQSFYSHEGCPRHDEGLGDNESCY